VEDPAAYFARFLAAFFSLRGSLALLFFTSLGIFLDVAGSPAPANRATFPAAVPMAFAAVTNMLSSLVSGVAAVFFGMSSVPSPSSWRPPCCCAPERSPPRPYGRFLCAAPASKPSRAASRPGSPEPSRSRIRPALSHH